MALSTHELVEGGMFKTKHNQIEFLTHTVPDVKQDTVIVGVCGIPAEDANPVEDGWFFSDFFAFNHLLKGTGSRQTWISCAEPRDLLTEYGEYLHGNPYCDRKVVLSETLLDELSPVLVFTKTSLHRGFLQILTAECDFARSKGLSVLVFLFGHGHKSTRGVVLGTYDSKLTINEFLQAIGGDLPVTVFSTACFSGGWAVHPLLNVTASTAAGPDHPSESWAASGSISRYCGSIYATALIQSLSECSSLLIQASTSSDMRSTENPNPVNQRTAQTETYNEFARTLHDILLTRVDRMGREHGISFCAQDDDWEMSWCGRTGVPLQDFKERWTRLPTRPSTMPPSSTNRDPLTAVPLSTPEGTARLQNFQTGRLGGLFGGTERSQRRFVKGLARDYLSTCPGTWTVGYGPKLHGMLLQFINDKRYSTAEILPILEYRYYVMDLVDGLCGAWNIPLPGGKKCYEFFEKEWASSARLQNPGILDRFQKAKKLIDDADLLPSPAKGQGHEFYHASNYLAAALAASSGELGNIEYMISVMKQDHRRYLPEQLEEIVRVGSVRRRAGKWLRPIAMALQELSPGKRKTI